MCVPEVSIIIVSYNTREMTLEAIRSVHDETRSPHEVIVIDNASNDHSVEAISSSFPDVSLLAETENHGFAWANNLAARSARADYLLLLNPDTVVLDGAIDRLLTFARRNPGAKIWGGRTLFADGSLNPASCWRAMSVWSLATAALGLSSMFRDSEICNPESYGGWKRNNERQVDIVSGCFFLVERAFWERLGGFDPIYVMYGEEADFCLRARALGARPRITPDAQIIHYAGASEIIRAEKMIRLLRAKTTLICRHFSPQTRRIGLMLLRFWPLSRALATGVLARFFGVRRYGPNCAMWRDVWLRRADWWEGYLERDV